MRFSKRPIKPLQQFSDMFTTASMSMMSQRKMVKPLEHTLPSRPNLLICASENKPFVILAVTNNGLIFIFSLPHFQLPRTFYCMQCVCRSTHSLSRFPHHLKYVTTTIPRGKKCYRFRQSSLWHYGVSPVTLNCQISSSKNLHR